jgi:uncharacterized protein (TIGR01777 family)
MKVVITGGSGQLGTILARHFALSGNDVVVVSRGGTNDRRGSPTGQLGADVKRIRAAAWDGKTLGPWASEVDGAEVVVNLAGRSVNCRYTEANLKDILASRVDSTRVVGEALAAASRPPRVWLQASAATIYAHSDGPAHGETRGVIGGDEPDVPGYWGKMVEVVRQWEEGLDGANAPKTRKIALRISMVLSPDRGGAFDVLLRLVRRGLGGSAADGRQYVSWITDTDFVRAVDWLIDRGDVQGPVNVTAPSPLTNRDFMRALRQAWGMPVGLACTKWMVGLGAWLMRTDPELVLKSRRAVPERLLADGFRFVLPEWPAAAKALVERWREMAAEAKPAGPGGCVL